MKFRDRVDGGTQLAKQLVGYANNPHAIIIALPRGGVVTGKAVADLLNLPLDITSPRKIGAPFNPELAIGAITETGEGIFNKNLIENLSVSKEFLIQAIEKEKKEALARLHRYRQQTKPRDLAGKLVILIDDGLATGSTMQAAIKTVKAEKASKIIVAVPVGPLDTIEKIETEVDEMICLCTPLSFLSVSQFYNSFDQISDEEVIEILQKDKL